jgi:hypothetical protein
MLFVLTLLLASLACDISLPKPQIDAPPPVETAGAAARAAGSAAGTAAAKAGDLAGTASALATTEGAGAIATVLAAGTPGAEFLKEKMAQIKPDADGFYRASLTEDEVNIVLRIRQFLTGDLLGAAIQSQEVSFEDGLITLSGSIMEPLPGKLVARMRPTVVDGQLQLNVEDASVAGQEAPQEAIDAAEKVISGAITEALGYVGEGIVLTEITATGGELTFVGR